MKQAIELVCPAGAMPALRAAVDHGADAVYVGLRGPTNARNFPGLNFDAHTLPAAIDYAHRRGTRLFVALNTYPSPEQWTACTAVIDAAAACAADALIVADMGLMGYACERHPDLPLHLSVQGSATSYEALNFYHEHFGIRRAVLPRVLSLAQVRHVIEQARPEIEVFGFGSLCVMVEGRCTLSSWATGQSPNSCGVCSPAHAVRWEEGADGRRARLNGVLIDRFGAADKAGYPVVCKGRYEVNGQTIYALEEPTSLSTLDILPELLNTGVRALKVEGRQRSPAYVAQVTRVLRAALDALHADPQRFAVRPEWSRELGRVAEGQTHTLGALHRSWQ
ncbi:MAG: U32 family peptidase [Chromatiales bacterium]|nr:U32 family peptidase [Chromatiales bacterium]